LGVLARTMKTQHGAVSTPACSSREIIRKKLWGTLFASPVLLCLVSSYFFFFADFFFAAFLVAMFSILPFDCSIEFATIFCCNC
jgi:hypothetical protein